VQEGMLPCEADAWSNAPLPAIQRSGTKARGAVLVVAGDDQTGVNDVIGIDVVLVTRRIEVENAAVLLGEAAIPVIAQAGGEREGRCDLELVLEVGTKLIGAVVAAGIALEE